MVTGGAGFIGTNFVLRKLHSKVEREKIVVMDALTYSGNLDNFRTVKNDEFFTFVQGDINNENDIESILEKYKPKSPRSQITCVWY